MFELWSYEGRLLEENDKRKIPEDRTVINNYRLNTINEQTVAIYLTLIATVRWADR